ncbi:hypothetical protein GCM10009839_93930 [Catenulispora yoronensis]|uniref:Transposase n=1 Tax=Catenulispora yoronensis TaxID=450799 RepID=A0ABN2VNC2_9ACTN
MREDVKACESWARDSLSERCLGRHSFYKESHLLHGHFDETLDSRFQRQTSPSWAKTHVQHVLTAIAVNIERLSRQEPADSEYRPRPPTAFQQYLDAHDLPRPIWWRQGK